MAENQGVSVLGKVTDLLIVDRQFKDDNGADVKYKRLVAVVEYDGVSEEIEFAPSQGKLAYRLLQLADDAQL